MRIVRVLLRRQGEPRQRSVEFIGAAAEEEAQEFLNVRRGIQVHRPWMISATLESGEQWETSVAPGTRKLDLREQLRISCQMERMYGDSWDVRLAVSFMESLDR